MQIDNRAFLDKKRADSDEICVNKRALFAVFLNFGADHFKNVRA
jgi:hypothetical protein